MSEKVALITVAFCLSVVLVKIFSIQFQKKLLDLPNERSSHTQPIPRGGGLGFILSFYVTLSIIIGLRVSLKLSVPIWISLVPLIVVGFLDDWKNLSAAIRYIVQLSVSTLIVFFLGPVAFYASQEISAPLIKLGAIALSIIGVTALINFYNFMDGLDGLVASTSIIQLSFLALWSNNLSLWILIAAILGFLVWNWHPAKIFMGDSGSTFIGATIAIALLSKDTNPSDAWAALTITLPITMDTIYTLSQRLIKGENIFQAHRSHLYQRLHQSGWSHAHVASLYAAAALSSSLSLISFGVIGGWLNLAGSILVLIITEAYLKKSNLADNSSISS